MALVAADGFFAQHVPAEAEGMLVVVPGVRPGHLPARGEAPVNALAATQSVNRGSVEPFASHAAEATALMLRAIANSDGLRANVVRNVLASTVHDSTLGMYAFDAQGDVVSSDAAAGFSVYRATAEAAYALVGALVPAPEIVSVARGS